MSGDVSKRFIMKKKVIKAIKRTVFLNLLVMCCLLLLGPKIASANLNKKVKKAKPLAEVKVERVFKGELQTGAPIFNNWVNTNWRNIPESLTGRIVTKSSVRIPSIEFTVKKTGYIIMAVPDRWGKTDSKNKSGVKIITRKNLIKKGWKPAGFITGYFGDKNDKWEVFIKKCKKGKKHKYRTDKEVAPVLIMKLQNSFKTTGTGPVCKGNCSDGNGERIYYLKKRMVKKETGIFANGMLKKGTRSCYGPLESKKTGALPLASYQKIGYAIETKCKGYCKMGRATKTHYIEGKLFAKDSGDFSPADDNYRLEMKGTRTKYENGKVIFSKKGTFKSSVNDDNYLCR
jgi:hypothetical protein